MEIPYFCPTTTIYDIILHNIMVEVRAGLITLVITLLSLSLSLSLVRQFLTEDTKCGTVSKHCEGNGKWIIKRLGLVSSMVSIL